MSYVNVMLNNYGIGIKLFRSGKLNKHRNYIIQRLNNINEIILYRKLRTLVFTPQSFNTSKISFKYMADIKHPFNCDAIIYNLQYQVDRSAIQLNQIRESTVIYNCD
jgi:hypothetical protein